MIAIRGADAIAALLTAAETLLVHEPGDAIATAVVPLFAQFHQDAWTAIRLPASGMDGLNFLGQRLIFQGAWAGGGAASLPVVITAGGNFQMAAQRQNGVISFHRMNPFIAFGDGSDKMAKVFFNMSRCSRRCRISRRAVFNWDWRSAGGPGFAPAAALPPAAAGAKRCFQAYSRLALIPNSSATTSADLRLASQLLTASRLNVSSNLRRVLTDVCVMGWLVHCRPNPPSVNSKQPEPMSHHPTQSDYAFLESDFSGDFSKSAELIECASILHALLAEIKSRSATFCPATP